MEYDHYANDERWPEFRFEMLEEQVWPGVWFTDAWQTYRTPADAMFTVAEVESEGDRQGVIATTSLPPIPKAVLITQTPFDGPNGLDPNLAAPIIQAGWKCLTEAYPDETADPGQMEQMALALGWPKVQPVFGLHRRPLEYFAPWMKGGWGVYLGEYDPRLL